MIRSRSWLALASVLLLACAERQVAGEAGWSTTTDTTGELASDCEPILQADGSPSGFEECESTGAIFRTSAELCVHPSPPSDAQFCAYGPCFSDDDCEAAPHGACELSGHHSPSCHCVYGCTSDADCGPGFVCMCSPVNRGTRCIEADCRTDADCLDGYRCELNLGSNHPWGWELGSLRCHGPDDECQSDADCPGTLCAWSKDRWQCTGG